RLAVVELQFDALGPRIAAAQAEWEAALAGQPEIDWTPSQDLIAHFELDGSPHARRGKSPTAAFAEGEAKYQPGRFGQAAKFDGRRFINAGDVARFTYFDKFSIAAWIKPDNSLTGTIASRMTDTDRADGWQIALRDGKVQVHLVKRWLDDAIRVETQTTLKPDQWQHLLVTYDGSRVAKGIAVYVDGEPQPLTVHLDYLNQSFDNAEPLRIGSGGGTGSRFRGLIDELRVYADALPPSEAMVLAVPETISEIASLPPDERRTAQSAKLRAYFLRYASPREIEQIHDELIALRRRRQRLVEGFPTVMIMQERPEPRPTHVLLRGRYDQPGERVERGVPAALPPLSEGGPNDRLSLARWLVDPSHPLTARVAVNRDWQMFFGTGLVETLNDFGSQGAWPSHPELLDWLAVELMSAECQVRSAEEDERRETRDERREPDSTPSTQHSALSTQHVRRSTQHFPAWDVKRLHRLIVT
ncbi:MAG: DUF1553 domain-containing protein, partial [Planctomycetaceae bacterium]